MVAEHTCPNHGAFGWGECEAGLDGALRNTQGHGADWEPEHADEGKSIQGALIMRAAGHPGT